MVSQINKTSLSKEAQSKLQKIKTERDNTPAAGAAPPDPPAATGAATAPPAGTEANLERPEREIDFFLVKVAVLKSAMHV